MQQPLVNLATASLLLCTTFFVYSSLQYLGDHEWASPLWQHSKIDTDPDEALLMENQKLAHALEEAQKNATLHAPAVATTTLLHESAPQPSPAAKLDGFAYLFYATADAYACSALVNVDRLQHVLNVTVPIHVLASSDVSNAYIDAFRKSNVTVHIEKAPELYSGGQSDPYYQDCLLKLLAFKMHIIDPTLRRVLAFDSDQLILRNLDHLFSGLPDVDLAAPRAYWLAKDFLASTFMMINLSDRLWSVVKQALDTVAYNKFDMDLINDLLGDTVMMLSGEFVTLNSHWEDWHIPRWYHPNKELNMTTVEILNKLARPNGANMKRQSVPSGADEPVLSTQDEPHESSTDARPDLTQGRPLTVIPALLPSQLPQAPPQKEAPALPAPPPTPRFPPNHPLTLELYTLRLSSAVVHFTAQGKPWMMTPAVVQTVRPDAHPVLAQQFAVWRETAERVCPNGMP